MMKWFRFSLGVCESPSPIGGSATIKNWYPPKEQGTATGVFFAATSLALIAVPPVAVWIMTHYGWRMVFYSFAIPGIVIALLWYLLVHTRPEESPHCNATEVEYIRKPPAAVQFNSGSNGISVDSLGWLDRIIRAKRVPCMETNREVFRTWNVWGASLAYFCICMVTYGMMTWIPTYLVTGKGYTFARMGWVASMPWIGALVGQLAGGWFSDKVLRQRRKPLLMFAPISLIVMMVVLLNAPNSVSWLAFILFLTGVLVNTCLPSYFAYPMGMTTGKTYPTALSVLTFVGNLGGFFSPMIMGYLLDVYKNFNVLFIYLAVCALLSLVMTTTIAEPIQSST
jgi:sugar phosphate permease